MNRSIMLNSVINAAAGLLLLVSGFCCSVIVARLLGPEANGTVAFALWLTTTGSLVAELGTGVLLLRLLPQLKAKGIDERARRGFAAYLAFPVLVTTVLLLVLYGVFCRFGNGIQWIGATTTVAALIGVTGRGESVRSNVSKRSPSTRISLKLGGVLRRRRESVPAPISRTRQPSRSNGMSNGSWTWPESTACAPASASAASARAPPRVRPDPVVGPSISG